jgi:membrane-bound ClpP family serine protease
MPLLNRLILTTAPANVAATATNIHTAPAPASDRWPRPGAIGKAVSELRPGGAAEFFDPDISDKRIAFVVSESGYLSAGTDLVVREVVGPSVVVRKKD